MTELIRLELLCLLIMAEEMSLHSLTSRISNASLGDHERGWVEYFNACSACNIHFFIILST